MIVKIFRYMIYCIKLEYLVLNGVISNKKANDMAINFLKD